MSHTREILGFLCRWALLAGAGGVSLAVAAAAARATGTIPQEVATRLAPQDCLAASGPRRAGPARLSGQVAPARQGGWDVAVAAAPGQALALVWAYQGRYYAQLDPPDEGTIQVTVHGIPYGGAAFQKARCLLVGVPPGRKVLLVDARLAIDPRGEVSQEYRRFAAAAGAAAEVVLFCGLAPESCRQMDERLRAAGVGQALLYDPRGRGAMHILGGIAREQRGGPRRRGLEVITADASLAAQAATAGFLTVLVAPAAPSLPAIEPLRRVESLTKLKDSPASGPIP